MNNKKIYLQIKFKDYQRYLTGDYYKEVAGDRDNAPESAYVDNIQIYKFQNTVDIEGSKLLEALMNIEPKLEDSLKQLIFEEVEKTID